nr:unnamed protein product [Callosobruchus analis]
MKLKEKSKENSSRHPNINHWYRWWTRTSRNFNPVIEAILEVINKKTIVGLYSPWDSDAQIIQDLTRHERVEVGYLIKMQMFHSKLPSCSSISQIQAFDSDEDEVQDTPRLMKSGSKRKFDNGGTKDAENTETPQVSKAWGSYTPKMLKKPMSQKLRVSPIPNQ